MVPRVLLVAFASYLIAPGANALAITNYIGHASVSTTSSVYDHMMPATVRGSRLLDAYLKRATAS